ncbi:MAG: peptide-methionine (S)-S-oxide reductase MsrA, partial [Salinigranum sp.]
MSADTERATFAGGSFWCVEAAFEELAGVEEAVSGYTGGTAEDPTYREVCTGETGHAEAVQVEYDPERLSYLDLLEVFFAVHDP